MLEIRLLNYFLILAEELHYSKAAERLNISQPTLSNQIKILESMLNVKLFDYIQKRTVLTEPGKILKQHVYKIFFDIEQAEADIKNYAGKSREQIKIGASGSHLLLMPCLIFNNTYNNILITMEEHSSSTIIENVKNGKLDLGLIYEPIEDSAIHSELLNIESYLAAVPLNSRLAEYSSVSLKDLVQENIILLPHYTNSRKNIDKAFSLINHICKPRIQATNLDSCVRLMEHSDNITILPNSYIKSINKVDFKAVPISDYPPKQTINLIYRKDLFLDDILKSFLGIIRDFHQNH
ncbi:LysR family transcriptional regulator [Clostridium fungisolvens]|uniref:HTH-type transcriptional regulator CynR n=1 Tax=Clostridium fungisolvens TaxID=1604897 RepID=A0A6V8SAY9_9CLOT|nr:LysR family transcriptional regulator [Clostridium fungisolvens]GFP74414.1 HTH-type transcriptional regulator CynR [Clostridium fungisolvens]